MKATLRHVYLCRTANMSWRTCVVVKQIQSNQHTLRQKQVATIPGGRDWPRVKKLKKKTKIGLYLSAISMEFVTKDITLSLTEESQRSKNLICIWMTKIELLNTGPCRGLPYFRVTPHATNMWGDLKIGDAPAYSCVKQCNSVSIGEY